MQFGFGPDGLKMLKLHMRMHLRLPLPFGRTSPLTYLDSFVAAALIIT